MQIATVIPQAIVGDGSTISVTGNTASVMNSGITGTKIASNTIKVGNVYTSGYYSITADVLVANDGASGSGTATTYTKMKETLMNETLGTGTFRISFAIAQNGTGGLAYGKIYLNDVAIGTERSTASGFDTFTEDIALTLVSGDKLQLYGKVSGAPSPNCVSQEFRVLGKLFVGAVSTTSSM